MSCARSHGRQLTNDHIARLDPEHRIAELEREVAALRRLLDEQRAAVAASELARDLTGMPRHRATTPPRRRPRTLRFTSDGWVHD